ncbi:MAG: ABC transporter permease [Hyphomicrobiaceae bacterium]|nr:ABC transporter permease [Hyphomicrobiaceae bacterium]
MSSLAPDLARIEADRREPAHAAAADTSGADGPVVMDQPARDAALPAAAGQPAASALAQLPRTTSLWTLLGRAVSAPGLLPTAIRRLVALVLGVVLWHLAVVNEFNVIINFENVSSPLEVWASFQKQLAGSMFYKHVGVSLQRIAIAYAIAAVLGIVIGLAMGRSRIAYDFIMPYVEIMRPIPAVAWIPLAILMWPTEESSIIYITFLGALFPIILNTIAGVQQTPEVLVRAARSLGARQLQIFRHVVVPAALPSIATGLSIGMGVAWFSLLAGEIISGQYGIGYFTWTAYHLIKYEDIIVGMLTIGFLGTASTMAVTAATRPFLKWQQKAR